MGVGPEGAVAVDPLLVDADLIAEELGGEGAGLGGGRQLNAPGSACYRWTAEGALTVIRRSLAMRRSVSAMQRPVAC